MAKNPYKIHIARSARRDIAAILKWSLQEFGEAAALRYEALIFQGLRDIAADPERPGSKERPEILILGGRTYHLCLSRSRVSGINVKGPRHFLLYRCLTDGVVEVGRVLHDSRDLQRHLPEAYRKTERSGDETL